MVDCVGFPASGLALVYVILEECRLFRRGWALLRLVFEVVFATGLDWFL